MDNRYLQDKLVSGENIKTINNNSILGEGNIAVQPTLVSGNNIKTLDGVSLLGSGDIQYIKNTANFHNYGLRRYKDITSYFQDGTLYQRINGTNGFKLFEDIYVGDYFNMGVKVTAQESDQGTSYGNIGSQYVTIAGLDVLMGNGDSAINYHHAVLVPGQGLSGSFHFGRHRMNASNTTAGGYVGSVMNSSVLGAVASEGKSYVDGGTINEQLYAIFGSHLKTTKELLSTAINASGYNRFGSNSGCSNSWAWTAVQAVLMSEVEVYGSIVWSSSGYDTGTACMQLPLFNDKNAINNRSSYYWLKDVASASNFCYVNNNGYANNNSASDTYRYVRPRFVIS